MKACVLFKPSVAYRRDAFQAGLKRLGYALVERPNNNPASEDLLVMWNRSIYEESFAKAYERAGAKLVIAENGYIGKDEQGGKLFALALNHHNGVGKWNVGTPARTLPELLALKPWRSSGDFLLLLPQRAIGETGVSMPRDWVATATKLLRSKTRREIRVRPHPGAAKTEPYEALKGAWAAVTWGSGAGIKALFAGVPVFRGLDRWIGASASERLQDGDIERPFLGDRGPMFERLAWAQWRLSEIESGEAFACLLR